MSQCTECSKEVGCACNLVSGYCLPCYNKSIQDGGEPISKQTARVVYKNLPDAPANLEFVNILKDPSLTREEKLKRINDILEKAQQKLQ